VEIVIAEPPTPTSDPPGTTAEVAAYEVYRTLDPAKTADYRLMRPLHRLDGPVFIPDSPPFDVVAGVEVRRPRVATYVDPTMEPWRDYL
jgi:hypothetical protein